MPIGIHIIAVETKAGPSDGAIFISVSNGEKVVQFGPNLSTRDKAKLSKILETPEPKVGCDILWHALDLRRAFNSDSIISPLRQLVDHEEHVYPAEYPVWEEYKLNPNMREHSGELAQAYAHGCVLWDGEPLECGKMRPVPVIDSPKLINIYMQNLVLFRMKWLEIQGVTIEMQGYTVSPMPQTKADKKHDVFRYQLNQTSWRTHLVDGTILTLYTRDEKYVPEILDLVKTRVKFLLPTQLDVDEITKCTITRGAERQSQLMQHLRQGQYILCQASVRNGGLYWCSQYFGLPSVTDQTLHEHFASEVKLSGQPDRTADEMNDDARRDMMRQIQAACDDFTPKFQEEGKQMDLNTEQEKIASSVERIVICDGYPGTGKTKTLGALVRFRFNRLMSSPSARGWVLCLTHTNVAALSVIQHITRYPSLCPYLRFSYSKMYEAFHSEDFASVDR